MQRVIEFGVVITLLLIGFLRVHAPAGERIQTEEKLTSTPDFLTSVLRTQREQNRTNRIVSSEGSSEEDSVARKMPDANGVRYVSTRGYDTNDGLSWETSKRTIYGAVVSLPGGGLDTAGSGTVYVGPASSANPTAGAG